MIEMTVPASGFYDTVTYVLVFSWAVWIAAALFLHLLLPLVPRLPSALSEMLAYGKLKSLGAARPSATSAKTPSPHKMLLAFMECLNSVPRRYFTHFYIWGSIWNAILLALFTYKRLIEQENILTTEEKHVLLESEVNVFLTLLLLLCQTLRRLLECLCVARHSERKMHFLHYILGFYFYTAVGPTAMLHLQAGSRELADYWFYISWRHALALSLFVWASCHQYNCHLILADLRSHDSGAQSSDRNSGSSTHLQKPSQQTLGIPHGDWFDLVSCPHYLAEILIYFSLVVVQWGSLTMGLPCSFVVLVLSLSARQMHSWYLDKFEDYPKNRKRIIPYIF